MLPKDFSGYLLARRQALGKSQSDFARALHYSVQAVAKYEKGQSEMNVASLIAAARFLEVDLDSFCSAKTDKNNTLAEEHDFEGGLFSKNLETLRENAGLTPEDVAQKIGISARSVTNYEKGRSYPSLSVFLAFADLYGVKPSAFFFSSIVPTAIAKSPAKRTRIHFLPLWIAIASLAIVGTGVGVPLYLSKKNVASISSRSSKSDSSSPSSSSQTSLATNSSADSSTSSSANSSTNSSVSSSASSATSSSQSASSSNSSASSSSNPISSSSSSTSSSSNENAKVVTATIEQDSDGFVGGSYHPVHFYEDGVEVTDHHYVLGCSYPVSFQEGDLPENGDVFFIDYRATESEAQLKITQFIADPNYTDRIETSSTVVATLPNVKVKALAITDYAAESVIAKAQVDRFKSEANIWKNKNSVANTSVTTLRSEGTAAGYITDTGLLTVRKSDETAMDWLDRYTNAKLDEIYAYNMMNFSQAHQSLSEEFYAYCYNNS